METNEHHLTCAGSDIDWLRKLSDLGLSALAVLLVLLMLAITTQVVCSALDINPVARFDSVLPVLGQAVSLNSLLDFQWHLLVIIGLIPAGLVWLKDKHVRVDFAYNKWPSHWRARVDVIGNLIFALPFFVLILPAAFSFMKRAWLSSEGSRNGGLNELWLVKAVLPLGIALLALAVLIETIRLMRRVRRTKRPAIK